MSSAIPSLVCLLLAAQGEEYKVVAVDATPGDYFGTAVALSGDTAVVGASRSNTAGKDSGAAYVYVRSGTAWIEQAKLLPNNLQAGDFFGTSVAIHDDTIVVGAPWDSNGLNAWTGSAFVFTRSGTMWSQQAKLKASDGEYHEIFGQSVATSGDVVAVGVPQDDYGQGINQGSVYIFARTGTSWLEQTKLTPSDPVPDAEFGWSISLDGSNLLIGAHKADTTTAVHCGAAYVLVRNGTMWTEQAKLEAKNPKWGDSFGESVAIRGDTTVVGAYWDTHTGMGQAGSAQVFRRNGTVWTLDEVLKADDAAPGDEFGYRVGLSDQALVATALGDDNLGGKDAGAAYVFTKVSTGWVQEAKLLASDGRAFDYFGEGLSVSDSRVFIGAVTDSHAGGYQAGSAYAFSLPSVLAETYCTSGFSASGCMLAMGSAGVPSGASSSGFFLTATGVEGDKDGLFFYGTNGRQANLWGNGTSFQCVVPPVNRGGLLTGGGTNGACDGLFSQDLNARWCPSCPKPSHNAGVGSVVQAQLWYRDPLSTSNQTTSLSDAIEFVVAP